jgi:uncharacterized membrane protein
MPLDDFAIARAVHVLAVVHWIGGVTFVALVLLPASARHSEPSRRIAAFEEAEGRFSFQAKISVTLAGLSGFYMAWRLDAWDRFLHAQFWWMHAMVLVWAIFTFILFIGEPLFLDAWFRRRAARDEKGTLTLILRAHWVLLSLGALTVAGAALGAHGISF